eukprot:s4584_g1.t1
MGALPDWLGTLSMSTIFFAPLCGCHFESAISGNEFLGNFPSNQLAEVPGIDDTPPETLEDTRREQSSEEELQCIEMGSAWLNKASYAGMTIVPFYLDFALDMSGIVQCILTGNYIFAVVSAMIFFMSLYQQVARGAISKLWKATCESLEIGESTDELEMIMLSEKLVEAPLQLMVQFYAFPFVTASKFAGFSFLCSLALSLKSVAEATYWLVELKLHDALDVMGAEREATWALQACARGVPQGCLGGFPLVKTWELSFWVRFILRICDSC